MDSAGCWSSAGALQSRTWHKVMVVYDGRKGVLVLDAPGGGVRGQDHRPDLQPRARLPTLPRTQSSIPSQWGRTPLRRHPPTVASQRCIAAGAFVGLVGRLASVWVYDGRRPSSRADLSHLRKRLWPTLEVLPGARRPGNRHTPGASSTVPAAPLSSSLPGWAPHAHPLTFATNRPR